MKEPLRVLLVDDEPLARLRLRSMLDAETSVPTTVAGEAGDTESALAFLQSAQTEPVDLLLLDIRMPGRDGLRLARVLRTLPQPPAVVFVTAHAEHALMAFELEALDYLTKPVRRERLQAALQRAWLRQRPADSGIAPLAEGPLLVVADRGRVLRLPLAEVLYLKAELKYVTLRTASSSHLLDESLAELEQRLQALGGPPFLRVHRNALVARHAIRALELREVPRADESVDDAGEGWSVRVAPTDEWLAVSRRQVAAVRAAMKPAP
jgi:two-component system, LytTR family, response regulator AlgR